MQLRVERHPSPLGTLLVVTSPDGLLRALEYPGYEARMLKLLTIHYGSYELGGAPRTRAFAEALEAYFAGHVAVLNGLPVATGGTPFQREVWKALRTIPAGSTLSYGQLAARLSRPRAARAVGLANGKNPISIVVPCHRVIGADGSLTGYAQGTDNKRWLLAHEARHHGAQLPLAQAL
jgi:methylated-DNA-[protein]-cysteine S-methyltransferase